jgi:hypothetical protein
MAALKLFIKNYWSMDVMELVHDKGYRMYKVSEPWAPLDTYIICSKETSGVLYRPQIAGKDLQDRMEKVAEVFMDAIGRTMLKGKKASQVTELVFLSGGLYYQLNHGFKARYGKALPQCFLGIKRKRLGGGAFTAVATYENFESLPDKATVMIGDTVATGATLKVGISRLLDVFDEKKRELKDLVVCSLACSVDGARLMKGLEVMVRRRFPGARLHLFVAEELFHLMPDGTDLRFLYDDCVMPDEARARILRIYGAYLGKGMKCAVFDWGTRCKNPVGHYRDFLGFTDRMLGRKLDAKSRSVLEKMRAETRRALADFERPL